MLLGAYTGRMCCTAAPSVVRGVLPLPSSMPHAGSIFYMEAKKMQEVARSLLDLARKGETNLRGRCVAAAACALSIGHRTKDSNAKAMLLHQQQCEGKGQAMLMPGFTL